VVIRADLRKLLNRPMKLTHTVFGQAGRAGRKNEDAARVELREDCTIAVLADGVGSAREGGAAAQRAVDMLIDYYLSRPRAWSPRRALLEFARTINRVFFEESELRYRAPELLCTLSATAIEGGRLFGITIGDSPVLLHRAGELVQLSQSHAFTEKGLEHGLTQALGLSAEVEPFCFETELATGDLVLICSDGVSGPLSNTGLAELCERRSSARHFVTVARERAAETPDSTDDATALVLDVVRRGWGEDTKAARLVVVAELSEGQVFDGYRLLNPLDETERVWLAESETSETVVLKFPPQTAEDDETRREAFLREAWRASRLDSPDFVRATLPTSDVLRYYVMEYVDAPSLRQAIAEAPLAVDKVVNLGRFLARAAQFLQSRDQAHGDIKPDNIAFLADGSFRMLDLGNSAEVYTVTSRAGTPSYLAPERFHGSPLSERSEIYAIGVTLYECLTRKYPHGEVERFQTPQFDGKVKAPSQSNPAVPVWLDAVVLRALASDVGERYQTYSELDFELSRPEQVRPYVSRRSPMLERNPLLFFKLLSLLLFGVNVVLLYRLARAH
jgi:serine/threonine protein phosphatase PrpC